MQTLHTKCRQKCLKIKIILATNITKNSVFFLIVNLNIFFESFELTNTYKMHFFVPFEPNWNNNRNF